MQNEFNGTFPAEIGELANLVNLGMAYNDKFLPAKVPSEFGKLTKLQFLWMTDCNLIGEIPDSFSNLSSLEYLDLSYNKLQGPIPEGLFQLKNLSIVYLYRNQLSGEIPTPIESLGLTEFDLSMNNLTGLHSKLEAFEISDNEFTGNLPENLCASKTLTGVVAFSNKLTGKVPESLGGCHSLRTIQLFNNNFSGERLAWNLTRLEISNNMFSGEIPKEVSSWASLVVFEASNNQFSGLIPMEFTSLPQAITLFLDGNSLTGEFPMIIESWKSLSTLNLARNKLSGPIPAQFGSLPNLLNLDLSENKFSGQIPPELGLLRLTTLNLSYNQLTGKIPDEFDNLAYEHSFLNNPSLCATNPISNLRKCLTKTRESKTLSPSSLAVILVFAVILFMVTVLLTFFVVRDYRRKKLKRKTCRAREIYRITVPNSEEFVAVKRIWNNRKLDHKLEKEFLAEVEILGTIRHSNIVKLICCISSEDSKLLVYEYMENQSLDKVAASEEEDRERIVFDLEWLVHRDVKSSNILLDSEFKPKIADFGLARILAKRSEPNTMSAVAGSFGYIAPDRRLQFRGCTLGTGDRERGNDGDEHTNLAEWAWRQQGEGISIIDALDKDIKEPLFLEEKTTVFQTRADLHEPTTAVSAFNEGSFASFTPV
ncbi:kinase family with leucine-rich repeat domain-containing protein [Actinidia rufa]|uniref:Kinase family with leucine-rich repeat domain-containing protein n=1 Tax=Actinidia rufa TaxID=165716 RepID=A0A7J0GCM9_9ERIC|nr:kinase family with leucine-rich repeat domain-containing protein [Actinidia rufa]